MPARGVNELAGVKRPNSVLVRGDSAYDIAKQIGWISQAASMVDFLNSIVGPRGYSDFEVWLQIPGNGGKTATDYFNFLGLAAAVQGGLALDQLGLDVVSLAEANAAVEDAASALAAAAAVSTVGLAPLNSPQFIGTVDIQQALTLSGDQTPAALVADTNDWAPVNFATRTIFRISTDAARNLTGIAGGGDGRIVLLQNVGNNPLTLKHENVGSIAVNRLWIGSADGATLFGDQTLRPGRSIWIIYDPVLTRWRPVIHGLKSTAAQIRAGTDDEAWVTAKNLNDAPAWIVAAGGEITTPGGVRTVTFNMANGFNRSDVMNANTTYAAPIGLVDGQSYQWLFIEDATGGRAPTLDPIWAFGNAGAPVFLTTGNKFNMITGTYHAGLGKIISNFWKGA